MPSTPFLNVLDTDTYCRGTFGANAIRYPSGSITDNDIASLADIAARKLQHTYSPSRSWESTVIAPDGEYGLHHVRGVKATVVGFSITALDPCTVDAEIEVDLLKNGVSVLSSPATLNATVSAYTQIAAPVATSGGTTGDTYSIAITSAAGAGVLAKGLSVQLEVIEALAAGAVAGAAVSPIGRLIKPFVYNDASPLAIGTIPSGSYATSTIIGITTNLDGGAPTLTVGDAGVTDRLMQSSTVNPKVVDTYEQVNAHLYAADTVVNLYITPDGSAQGVGVVIVEYA